MPLVLPGVLNSSFGTGALPKQSFRTNQIKYILRRDATSPVQTETTLPSGKRIVLCRAAAVLQYERYLSLIVDVPH